MNAAQHHNQLPGENAAALTGGADNDLAISALVDGELRASELGALLASLVVSTEAMSDWHAYQVIGDVLRGHEDPVGSTSTRDFLAAVRRRLQTQDIETDVTPLRPAEVIAVGTENRRSEAANDAVFRWKLVAGLASIAAVMAVSWSVLVGSGGVQDGAAGAQLALTSPGTDSMPTLQPTTAATAAVPSTATPVVVSTDRGVLIRDAQLEALLAEHRQHGGMSALQMPSGFIRNATYDAAGR
ncbi:sigma-E factor negative regulatory protein [Hydrogenophaga sp.]|uniref:sigma-E factor negative regulatory protein n=1 Tax=Hydrogenophaga sp. TaxID=1904254 RepID=UPI002FC8722A